MPDTVKLLLAALVSNKRAVSNAFIFYSQAKVSSTAPKNGESALAVSNALTKALVKFKETKKQADAELVSYMVL